MRIEVKICDICQRDYLDCFPATAIRGLKQDDYITSYAFHKNGRDYRFELCEDCEERIYKLHRKKLTELSEVTE